MSALTHPDYKIELEKLNYTLKYLKVYDENILKSKQKIDNAVEYAITHYNSDNAEQFNELIINTNLQESMAQKIKDLAKSHSKPYFARVDFKENSNNKFHRLYIGKISLYNEKVQDFIVLDWRAPISNLYYEGRLGKASYNCPEGEINGEIQLKRQYTIENSQLQEIYDIDITTNDDFLQACLGSSKDNRLKDIVSTIQAEQNRVIRADMWKPLIVQGAAGGGKTTIALHRIAYLLYAYEKSFSPKNFMIVAPNRFFLSYISEVLPELGVENVKQTTFEDFAMEIISKKLKIKENYEKLSLFVNNTEDNSTKISNIKKVSEFKSSIIFKNLVEAYTSEIEKNFIPKENFSVDTFTLLTYEELNYLFLHEYKTLPFMKRINEIKKHLVNNLKYQKPSILKFVQDKYDRKIDKLRDSMKDSTERRKLIIDIADKRDSLIEKIKKESKTLISNYLSKIKPLTALEYYNLLINDEALFYELGKKLTDKETLNSTRIYSKDILHKDLVEIEDLAPIMYIKYLIYGLEDNLAIRHMIIDEAQDYSLFQLYVLKKVINTSSFTILGDLCQGIYSFRGIQSWNDVSKYVFGDVDSSFLTLEQSYRTTIEIMESANSVIKYLKNNNLPSAKPVIRHGDKVIVIEKNTFEEIALDIIDKIDRLKEYGYKSAAIICKTFEECKKIKTLIKNSKIPSNLISGNEKEFKGGVVVVPSYLVKGLEFDMVILANASANEYKEDELDIKLLYIAMTRPLHKLFIYSLGKRCEMLKDL